MGRVVLQDLAARNRVEDFVKDDVFLDHLLMGVLGDADVLRHGLGLYPREYGVEVGWVSGHRVQKPILIGPS